MVAGQSTGRFSPDGGAVPKYYVVIKVNYDDFPAQTGWILRESAGILIAGQSMGSFSTQDGAVSKTANIARERHRLRNRKSMRKTNKRKSSPGGNGAEHRIKTVLKMSCRSSSRVFSQSLRDGSVHSSRA